MPKQLETRNFSILNMKDDYEEASELLLKAMIGQNPDIDADSFDIRLRELISRFGNSNGYSNSAFAALANEDINTPTIYNSAGDFLAIAYASYHDGDKKQAMDMFETAMEEPDARTLFEAVLINNKRSAIGIEADESDENPDVTTKNPKDDIDESDEDNNEIVDLPDDDDDNSDNLDAGRVTDTEVDIAKASLNDFMKSLSEEETDTDEQSPKKEEKDSKKPMSKVEESKETKKPVESSLIRAAGNKLSLTGSAESRQQARKFKTNAR